MRREALSVGAVSSCINLLFSSPTSVLKCTTQICMLNYSAFPIMLLVHLFPLAASEYSSYPVWILTGGVVDTGKRCNRIIEREEMGEKGGGSCDIVKSGSRSRNKRWPGLLLHIMTFIRLLASSFCWASLVISGLAPCGLVDRYGAVRYHATLPCAWI